MTERTDDCAGKTAGKATKPRGILAAAGSERLFALCYTPRVEYNRIEQGAHAPGATKNA